MEASDREIKTRFNEITPPFARIQRRRASATLCAPTPPGYTLRS
jgi:hypothetical protein